MRNHFSTGLMLTAALLAAGCTQQGLQKADDGQAGRFVPVAQGIPINADWTAVQDDKGQVWTAWYGQRPALNLTQPDGKQASLLAQHADATPSGLALAAVGENVWTAYRSKKPVRDVFLQRTGHAPQLGPVGVSGDTVSLARMKLHVREDGGVDVLWYGERGGLESPYNVFVRSLDAEGKPLDAAPQHVLLGIYPQWINEGGKQGVVSWLGDAKSMEDQSSVVVRTREAAPGAAFGPEVLVRKTTASIVGPLFNTLVSGKRWLTYWEAQYGKDRREYLIEGGYSDDQGTSWQPFEIESLRGVDIYSMRMAGNGKVVLGVMAVQRAGKDRGDTELRVVRSTDNGQTWGDAFDLRDARAAYGNVGNPRIAFLDEKRVVVIWQDWREIRSRVRYAYSEDAGETWKVKDGRLPFISDRNMQLYFQANALFADGQGGADIVMEVANDAFTSKDLYRLHLSAQDLAQSLPDFWPEEGNLRQRVAEFWQAMRAEDYKTSYAMYDPFFRVNHSFRSYMTDMGAIVYGETKINEIKIDGYTAHVTETVEGGRPYFDAYGKLKSDEMKPREMESVWVWIDGQWHRQYELEQMGAMMRYTRY